MHPQAETPSEPGRTGGRPWPLGGSSHLAWDWRNHPKAGEQSASFGRPRSPQPALEERASPSDARPKAAAPGRRQPVVSGAPCSIWRAPVRCRKMNRGGGAAPDPAWLSWRSAAVSSGEWQPGALPGPERVWRKALRAGHGGRGAECLAWASTALPFSPEPVPSRVPLGPLAFGSRPASAPPSRQSPTPASPTFPAALAASSPPWQPAITGLQMRGGDYFRHQAATPPSRLQPFGAPFPAQLLRLLPHSTHQQPPGGPGAEVGGGSVSGPFSNSRRAQTSSRRHRSRSS